MTPEFRIDLHVHSEHSPDSRLTVPEIVAGVRARGLQGFALTDHNSIGGHAALRDAAARHPDLLLVPGAELSTVEGHLLAYGVSEVPASRLALDAAIAWVRDRGGEPVLAHPYRRFHGVGDALAVGAEVRAVEARNGQNSPSSNRRAEELVRRRGIGSVGGSDAHLSPGIGRAFTVVAERPSSTDDLLDAIRHGRTSVGGSSLDVLGRIRWGLRNGALRLGRGLRPV